MFRGPLIIFCSLTAAKLQKTNKAGPRLTRRGSASDIAPHVALEERSGTDGRFKLEALAFLATPGAPAAEALTSRLDDRLLIGISRNSFRRHSHSLACAKENAFVHS